MDSINTYEIGGHVYKVQITISSFKLSKAPYLVDNVRLVKMYKDNILMHTQALDINYKEGDAMAYVIAAWKHVFGIKPPDIIECPDTLTESASKDYENKVRFLLYKRKLRKIKKQYGLFQ